MPEAMKSAATTSSFNPDTASEEDMMVYRRVTALVEAAAEGREPRIQIKVEPGVTDLRPRSVGNRCFYRTSADAPWTSGDDIAVVIKIGVDQHEGFALCATPFCADSSKRLIPRYLELTNLSITGDLDPEETAEEPDGEEPLVGEDGDPDAYDERRLRLGTAFAGLNYREYCRSSGYHRAAKAGERNPSYMSELDEGLHFLFLDGILSESLRNDISFDSKGRCVRIDYLHLR